MLGSVLPDDGPARDESGRRSPTSQSAWGTGSTASHRRRPPPILARPTPTNNVRKEHPRDTTPWASSLCDGSSTVESRRARPGVRVRSPVVAPTPSDPSEGQSLEDNPCLEPMRGRATGEGAHASLDCCALLSEAACPPPTSPFIWDGRGLQHREAGFDPRRALRRDLRHERSRTHLVKRPDCLSGEEGSIPFAGARGMPRVNLLHGASLPCPPGETEIIRDYESRVPGSIPGEGAQPLRWNGYHACVRSTRTGFESRKRHWVDRAARLSLPHMLSSTRINVRPSRLWRNRGRRTGLRHRRPEGHPGSNPGSRTARVVKMDGRHCRLETGRPPMGMRVRIPPRAPLCPAPVRKGVANPLRQRSPRMVREEETVGPP